MLLILISNDMKAAMADFFAKGVILTNYASLYGCKRERKKSIYWSANIKVDSDKSHRSLFLIFYFEEVG